MQFATEVFGDVAVVHVPEELSEEVGARLGAHLNAHDKRQLVIDLDGAESIDSAGLTALLDAQEAQLLRSGNLKIYTQNAINRKILEITGLDRQLEVFESVIEAVKSYA